jgi:5-formyltetrahydrofolate cyclo-ligase
MTKKELRKIYLKKRMEVSDAEYDQLNQQLSDNFFTHVDLSYVRVLHTFLPIKKHREVNTFLIIERLNNEFPNIQISIPKINNQTSELEHYYFEGLAQLKNNMWEIPEPVKGIPTPTEKIDAVLAPLLAFDRHGHRLGYGRGFYDRFLSKCRPDCLKIGLSFFDMEEKIHGITEKDIPLNLIITPLGAVAV